MKKIFFLSVVTFFVTAIHAQTPAAKTTLKDHVCTSSCKEGKHMYAHEEKGHECKDGCKKMAETVAMPLKEHVCMAACKESAHVYLHGEKGHVCTEDCKKMMTDAGTVPLKEHVCTKACKSSKHKYVHGEKGHECIDKCKKPAM